MWRRDFNHQSLQSSICSPLLQLSCHTLLLRLIITINIIIIIKAVTGEKLISSDFPRQRPLQAHRSLVKQLELFAIIQDKMGHGQIK